MANSTPGQSVMQQLSWTQRIPIGRSLRFLAGRFKHALGFGRQDLKERELIMQRDDLQNKVDSLLAENHEFANQTDRESRSVQENHSKQLEEAREMYTTQIDGLKAELNTSMAAAKDREIESESKLVSLISGIATLEDGNKRLQELRDNELQAHHHQVESMQAQLNARNAELGTLRTLLQEVELLARNKDAMYQASLQTLEEQLKKVQESLDSSRANAEEKHSAHRVEIDVKVQQVVGLQAKLDRMQLQLNSKDDLLRSTLKDLKARAVGSESEEVRKIMAAIENGLPQLTYPTLAEQRLQNHVHKSYKHRVQQMQAVRQKFLKDSKEQPGGPASTAVFDEGSDITRRWARSGTDDDDSQILEHILSSMKVALPRVVAGQTPEVFFEPYTEHSMQQQVSNWKGKPDSKVVYRDSKQLERQEFYKKWPRSIYTNLPLNEDSIRLVELLPGSGEGPIEIHMAVHQLQDVSRQYEALSYVCGEQQAGHWITLNGEKVEIFPNLHNALTWLRRPTSIRRMWIDAICINQRSENEKSKEIQNMGPFYNQAKAVNIFLGAPQPSKMDSISTLMKLFNREPDTNSQNRQDQIRYEVLESLCDKCDVKIPDVRQGFINFCLQPWWRRIWTMEFYLAAEEPLFYWGKEYCSTAALKRDFELLEPLLQDVHTSSISRQRSMVGLERDSGPARPLVIVEARRISRYIRRCYRIDDYEIPRRLYSELVAGASDPHDYVYGLRAMFGPVFKEVFVPDYLMSPEMLFACLAVYLIMVEGWIDLLWWYPTRYNAKENIASWWPNFSLRSMPHELDVKPLELNLAKEPRLNWDVRDHLLHIEGYLLDRVYSHRHIDKSDGHKILSELWQFDHCMNWNHECNEFFAQVADTEDPWVQVFWEMHYDRYTEMTHFNSSFRGALLQSTINEADRYKLPPQIAECVPCWDVLLWRALRVAHRGLPEALGQDSTCDEPGLLEDIFSSRMRLIFREAFAEFFMGACIFDWGHLSVWLRRFPTASQWSASNQKYWASATSSPPNGIAERSEVIAESYHGYTNEIHDEIMRNSWCYSFYYVFLAYVILLDCDDYGSLANTIQKLQKAAEQLRQVYHTSTIAQIQDLASQVPLIADRLDCYDTVLDLFRNRYLLWTVGGFRGISCPGVETCCGKNSVVVIVDGLSFPAVVNDFNEKTGEGRLAGCVLLRGVDMLDGNIETVSLPYDYKRGEKREFKLR